MGMQQGCEVARSGSAVAAVGAGRSQRTARVGWGSEPRDRRPRPATTPAGCEASGDPAGPRLRVRRVDDEFESFQTAVRAELAPAGLLEELLAGSVIDAAWALTRAEPRRRRATEQRLACSLAALERLRGCRRPRRLRPYQDEPGPERTTPARPEVSGATPHRVEGLGVRADTIPDAGSEHAGEGWERGPVPAPAIRWSQRLGFDPEVASHSPVIRGTWVTASQVVALILEGWSWAEILRTHPELTEDDIRACLAYTVEAEELGLTP